MAAHVSALDALATDGVCHMSGVLDAVALDECQTHASERLYAILRHMLLKQVMSETSEPSRYQEVVERDGGRLDVRHGVHDAVVTAILRRAPLRALLLDSLGGDAEVVAAGNVVAMSMEGWMTTVEPAENVVLASNMGPQAWHADGAHLWDGTTSSDANPLPQLPAHALTVFIPLCDIHASNGPTEFCLGSHVRGCEYDAEAETGQQTTRALHAKAGDAIVFDYRVWHRGGANASETDRQVFYLVVAKPWWHDRRNYNQGESLFAQCKSAGVGKRGQPTSCEEPLPPSGAEASRRSIAGITTEAAAESSTTGTGTGTGKSDGSRDAKRPCVEKG